tara:strand:- start:267 stop:467 length:201 start_codon:yes stop_codon:yes gene_type:complete
MPNISKENVLAQAREFGGEMPSEARAEALAANLNVLIGALDEAAADLPLEAEPADMARTLEELAGD